MSIAIECDDRSEWSGSRVRGEDEMEEQANESEPREVLPQERPADALVTLLGDVTHLALSLAETYEKRTRPARREQLHFV